MEKAYSKNGSSCSFVKVLNETFNIKRQYNKRCFQISIKFNEQVVMEPTNVRKLAAKWEYASFQIEKMQCDPKCAQDEMDFLNNVESNPKYECNFNLLQYIPDNGYFLCLMFIFNSIFVDTVTKSFAQKSYLNYIKKLAL